MGKRVLFVGVLLCITVFAQGAVTGAVEYGGIGGVPANPDPSNDRTKSIFIYNLAANQSKSDGVRVVNNSDQTKTIEVYATDSEISSGGSFACKQKTDDKKDVGNWINLSKNEVTLAPVSDQVVNFSISLPGQVDVGEHNGCLVIQEKGQAPGQGGNGVQLNFRSAIRVAVTVPGEIIKDIGFSNLLVRPEDKKYILTAELLNKGNVSVDTDVKVSVKNWLNRQVYQNGGVYPLLAQKQPMQLNFEYPRPFWGGLYWVSGSATYNSDPTAQLGDSGEKNTKKDAPAKLLFVMPQLLAAILELLLLLLLLVLAFLVRRRFKNRRAIIKTWQPYTVRSGDTLPALAKNRRTKWRTIAKFNKIKPPYVLQPGTKIILPPKNKSK